MAELDDVAAMMDGIEDDAGLLQTAQSNASRVEEQRYA